MTNKGSKFTSEQFDLLWLSALALFFELVAIRWLASEVRAFSIFKNFPLIACYIGLGYGFMKESGNGLFRLFPILFLILIAIVTTSDWTGLTYILIPGLRVGLYTGWIDATHPPSSAVQAPLTYAALSIAVFFAIFVIVATAMAALGQQLGKLFNSGPALQSYLINLIGSALGIAVFSILSFMGCPPLVWVSVGSLAALWTYRKHKICMGVLLACIAVTALIPERSVFTLDPGTKPRIMWSQYHRVDVAPLYYGKEEKEHKPVGIQISVNKGYFQQGLNLSPEFTSAFPPDQRAQLEHFRFSQYELPYFFVKPKRVLIMGSGTGNDVAAALRNGAEHIDAVEIEGKMIDLGRELHPEHPYDSPKVTVHVNDARAFLRQHPEKYDLVMTGFLDSHTVAGNSLSVRLDDYVYTKEGMEDALAHVSPGGLYSITYCTVADYLSKRMTANMHLALGGTAKPLIVRDEQGGILHMFAPVTEEMKAKVPDLLTRGFQDITNQDTSGVRPSTDDWPFLYLSNVAFDPLYLTVNACILLLAWVACMRSVRQNSLARRWHLFFLGAAFLLLELAIIDRLALVFGTTWFVNSVCIFAVLTAIIAANVVVIKYPNVMPLKAMYTGLLTSLIAVYLTPLQSLNALGIWTGGSIAAALSVIPIFFAGLIFSTTFQKEDKPSVGLAFNLLGAVVGGLLEYVATFTGIRSLLLVAAVLYSISLAIWMYASKPGAPAPGGGEAPADN